MIPVYQTIFDSKKGNCWAACLASIFEIPLNSIPWPNGNADDFWPTYIKWLEKRNAGVFTIKPGSWIPPGYVIGSVESPRFPNTEHAVVVYKDKVVHDPHPSKESVRDDLSQIISLDIILPIDPSKPMLLKDDVSIGDYVLATKYKEGGPRDHWCVGIYSDKTCFDRYIVVNSNGVPFRATGFRRIKKISQKRGEWIIKNKEKIEAGSHSLWWWLKCRMS